MVRDCLDDVLPVKQQLACGKLLLQMLTKAQPLQSYLPRWHDTAVGGSRDDTRGREVERWAWQQLIPLLGIGHWALGIGHWALGIGVSGWGLRLGEGKGKAERRMVIVQVVDDSVDP